MIVWHFVARELSEFQSLSIRIVQAFFVWFWSLAFAFLLWLGVRDTGEDRFALHIGLFQVFCAVPCCCAPWWPFWLSWGLVACLVLG